MFKTKKRRTKLPALVLAVLIPLMGLNAQTENSPRLNWTVGFTTYSYFSQGIYATNRPNSYFGSLMTSPTVGLDLFFPKINFGLEQTYYADMIPTTDNISDLSWSKRRFTAGAYYLLADHFKFSLFYSIQDYGRNLVGVILLPEDASVSTRHGLGLAFGYRLGVNTMEIRKELINTFRDGNRLPQMQSLFEQKKKRAQRQ
jgi:hypothetical protein